jgi:hypothetical protein
MMAILRWEIGVRIRYAGCPRGVSDECFVAIRPADAAGTLKCQACSGAFSLQRPSA